MQTMTLENSIRALEQKVRSFKGAFSLNDAAAVTGLAVDEAKEALDAMMSKYVCRLMVTENGDMIYSFGNSLQRRGEKTWAERWDQVGEWAWKIFTVIFKAWIAVTLVVYFIVFLVLLIALLVAATQGGGRDRKSPVKLDGIFRMFFSIFQWRTATAMIQYQTDRQGYRYRQYQPRPSVLNENKKNFIASVYDFVFGPARVLMDPLANEKEVAAYLRQEKGIITPAELVALGGKKIDEAEAFLSECIVRFKGDAEITDNGVVYGRFDQLTRGMDGVEEGKIEYFWEEYEPEYEVTGNTSGRNAGIIFMNAFNLIFSGSILYMVYASGQTVNIPNERLVVLFLGWLPFIFSLLFFGVPVARAFKIRKLKRRRLEMNKRKRIMRVLFQKVNKSATIDEIIAGVNSGKSEKPLLAKEVEQCLEGMMRDYQGETQLDSGGKVLYAFPRLADEMTEAMRLRATRNREKDLGDVIFDSKG